jgi:hypothetical protein
MRVVDADKFLAYLIFSKHIDGLTCGEVKEAVEMCKVDVLDKIRAEIADMPKLYPFVDHIDTYVKEDDVLAIIDKYKAERSE